MSRADSGKRTAPSARDWREIDVYVATAPVNLVYVTDFNRMSDTRAEQKAL
ncbi:MAG: hypothetical protein KJ958_11420 [Gammaproteobacteria bacterium]|nr:hypothetical protein [Gammaproteobacteria bacterium]MBU1979763.1 hypothetical protein [Gammaproteobacteria bacterium]